MTSRVEELQRMVDNINENGGLNSGEWHTAMLTQIAQNLAVIADVMMADRKTEPQIDSCEVCEYIRNCDADKCNGCCKKRKTEPTGDKLSAVEDEPLTCDGNCWMKKQNGEWLCQHCQRKPKDEQTEGDKFEVEEFRHFVEMDEQTDCETCRHYKLSCELFSEVCKYEPTTQTEIQK